MLFRSVFMLPLDEGGGSSFSHWTYRRKDGHRFPGALRLRRMQDGRGQLQGFLVIALDISAEIHAQQELQRLNGELEQRVQRRTEELSLAQGELLRSERLAALGSLVAGVSHELNTPLGNCLTTASTLEGRSREIAQQLAAGTMRRSTLEHYLHDVGKIGRAHV